MENSEEGKTETGLARVTKNADGFTIKYDSKEVVFNTYQRGVMSAGVEYRSAETMSTLNDLYNKAVGAKGTYNEKLTNDALEKYLNEIINTMEILDIE